MERPMVNYYKPPTLLLIVLAANMITTTLQAFDQSHQLFTDVLSKYVIKSKVDYKGLKADPAKLDQYISQLSAVSGEDLTKWSKEEKLAYWINAYNAFTLKVIIDHYPVKSIKKIKGGKVWDKVKFKAGGQELTLNDIEHKRLRAELKEPLIHFAINCASIGCPILSSEAYKTANLYEHMESSAKALLKNREQFRIDYQSKTIHFSKIFKWFGEDFNKYNHVTTYKKHNGIVSFAVKYLPKARGNFIKNNKLDVKFLHYDWNLNETS